MLQSKATVPTTVRGGFHHRPLRRLSLAATLGLLLTSSAAVAAREDTPSPPDDTAIKTLEADTALVNAQAAYANAKAARSTAEAAALTARLEALGLKNDATGKTTIDSANKPELEGWILTAGTINKAAKQIAAKVVNARNGRIVVVLAADEAFDLTLPTSLTREANSLRDGLSAAAMSLGCSGGASGSPAGSQSLLPAASPLATILPAVLGLLKTDTEISGYAGPTDARLLVNAITGEPGQWLVPGEVADLPETGGALDTALGDLAGARQRLTICQAQAEPADKATLARFDAVLAPVNAFQTRIADGADGLSQAVKALRLQAIKDQKPLVLRVFLEKSGGSMLLRKNLWTALGAPAVGLTGGLVTSWRLVDPADGRVIMSGLLRCRTALTNMRSIQSGTVNIPECDFDGPA